MGEDGVIALCWEREGATEMGGGGGDIFVCSMGYESARGEVEGG